MRNPEKETPIGKDTPTSDVFKRLEEKILRGIEPASFVDPNLTPERAVAMTAADMLYGRAPVTHTSSAYTFQG